jgi:hypothetical protein
MAELVRDYLQFYNSFLDGNMATLRKLTAPLKDADYEKITDPQKINEARVLISSGGSTKRYHQLSTIHFKLSIFLN